jgi:hypothetical protein
MSEHHEGLNTDPRPTVHYLIARLGIDPRARMIVIHADMKRLLALLTVALLTLPRLSGAADADESGFHPLFNGKDLTGWHLRNPAGHPSWSILPGGVLKNTVEKGAHGTDLVADKKFWNFTVRYEYMTPENSNSGFYLRGRHEIQILGDYSPNGQPSLGGNGALYNFKAPDKFVTKPAGQWQTVEATMIGNRITVVMNGVKIHDNVVCDKATGSEIDNKLQEPGPIFLQGDHGTVSFRNIRIKELPKD